MTTIKDRLKMFETNGPPIKPKPKINALRKNSNADPGIINVTESDELIKNSRNDLVNVAEVPPKIKNEVSVNVNELLNEQNYEVLHQNKSTHIINDRNDGGIDQSVKGRSETDKEDVINNKESDKSYDIIIDTNEINTNLETEGKISESPAEDSDDDLTYDYYGSIYYLPGLENYFFSEEDYETALVPPIHHDNESGQIINDLQTNPTVEISETIIEVDLNIEEVATNLKRNASKRLIEEIFNTSLWRNSINYNDNFIFTPTTSTNSEFDSSGKNSSNDISSIISSSPSNDDRRKSLQSLSSKPIKKNIFSGMFRSKRGPKKSNEKTIQPDQTNENYDSDGHRESTSKRSTHSKTVEGDTDSAELATKKPLNTFFNRDWLNSLGEGIKKKANVMSELRKVFTHNKGKHLKNKPVKRFAGTSNEVIKLNTSNGNGALEDDLYDDGGEDTMSSEEDTEPLPVGSKPAGKENINKANPICISNDDDIYDEDDDDDIDKDHDKEKNINNDFQNVVKSSSKESVYDDGGEDEVSDSQNNQIVKCSSHESLYDDGGEEETCESITEKEPEVPLVKMRRGNVANLKNKLEINFNIPMKAPTTIQISKPLVVDDSIYDDEDDDDIGDNEENKKVYSKEKIIENLKIMHKKLRNNEIAPKKSDLNSGNSQQPKKTSSIKDESVKLEADKLEEINKKSDESRKIIYQTKTKDKKSSSNNISDFRMFLEKITKNKSNNQKSKKVEKVKSNNKKPKNNCVKLKHENKKNEEYDMDDENVEEYEYDVKNDDDNEEEEVTTGSIIPNLQKNQPNNKKVDEEMYDIDNYDIEIYISDEIDDVVSESVCQNKITKLNIPNKKKQKHSKKAKNNDDIYDDDEVAEEEVECVNIESKTHPKKLLSKKSEITKKNIKTKKAFVEEYQEEENITSSKVKVVKEIKNDKLKTKSNVPVKSDKKMGIVNSKNCDDIYDEEYDEEEFNEVYVSDVEINDKKESHATKWKDTKLHDATSKKAVDNSNKEKKKKHDANSKTKISSSHNDCRKPNKKDKSAMETYIYDEDESLTNESPKNKCSNEDEFFDNEDPAVMKLIKKNLSTAKKTFKLKDDMIPQSLAKVLKTVYSQNKNHLQLNIGELVQILFHKDSLALVRNGLGKCGWTSPGNLQIIKLYESLE